MADVPEPVREFIRVWVHEEALRSTRALRHREAIEGRYRRGRDGRLRMRRRPIGKLSESSRDYIQKHPPGTTVKAVVNRFEKSSAWVQFGDDLLGRVDRKEISWSDATPDLRRYLRIGGEYEFMVRRVNISHTPAIIELSLKRTISDPWHQDNLPDLARLGVVDGKVVRWVAYGVFVEIKPDLVGLVHRSSLPEMDAEELEARMPVGSTLEVTIESISIEGRRMSLVPVDGAVKTV